MNPSSRQHRPIRSREVKKLSIVRNPGTGPLIERLREKPMQGPIGFTRPERLFPDPELDLACWQKVRK
jgi:hypothetical protein